MWLRLFALSRDNLPEGYVDAVFAEHVRERLEALEGTHGREFVAWVISDAYSLSDGQGRDFREVGRDVRDSR